jgi:hypothetical protein
LAHLPHATAAYLTGRSFFPRLISASFMAGLRVAFDFAAIACAVAAVASWLRGGKYVHREEAATVPVGEVHEAHRLERRPELSPLGQAG